MRGSSREMAKPLLEKVTGSVRRPPPGFCPGVRVHKGITIVLSLFRSHWLAAVYCLVLCIGSCEPVHADRINLLMVCIIKP